MATLIPDGNWLARLLSASYGDDPKTGVPTARANFEIASGPATGRRITYNGQINNKSGPYVRQDCLAIGWTDVEIESLEKDAEAWIERTGGLVAIDVEHKIARNKADAQPFAVVRSIGRGQKPLAPPSPQNRADANAALKAAKDLDTNSGVSAADDTSLPF